MDGITELAKRIKDRDNPTAYSPMFGTITELPELKIQMGSKIILTADNITAIFDIYEKEYDDDGNFVRYANLDKEIVLLPYGGKNNKYIALGCVV